MPLSSLRWLQRLALLGTLAALAILGASALLRLSTVFALDGHPLSTLPAALEHATRLLHRLCASAVALLALGAIALCWTQRHSRAGLAWPVAWIVAATVILALIGPLTPGYKLASVTVANVSVGVVLLVAFWWLYESATQRQRPAQALDGFGWATLAAVLVQVATGAGASAAAMHALHWPTFVHLGTLPLALILIGAVLLDQRRARARQHAALAGLLALQLFAGYVLMGQEPRSVGLSFFHAMLAPLLAMALVSLSLRGVPGAAQG
ncbi:MAG: hypothetical protein WCH44_12280 [Betaproteobacteria bacterium]